MGLRNYLAAGALIVGALLASPRKADSAPIYPWQIQETKKEIIVHTKQGDTLGDIVNYLDHSFGNDDPNDAVRSLDSFVAVGDINYADCRNPIANKDRIEAGRDLVFKGKALGQINPDYVKEQEEKKDIEAQISKPNKKTEPYTIVIGSSKRDSSEADESEADSVKTEEKRNNYVVNGDLGASIFSGVDREFGWSSGWGVRAGYEQPKGLGLLIGYRTGKIDGNEFFNYKRSFFGLVEESNSGLDWLDLTELNAQITLGSEKYRFFGGVGIKSVGKINERSSEGWRQGEGGVERDYGDDRFRGSFGGVRLTFPFDKDLIIGVEGRHGKYKTKAGLELNETFVGGTARIRLF